MTVQTPDQRLANLGRANEIRTARSLLKQRLTRGEAALAEVLREDPDYVQTMRLADLLKAVPKLGTVKVNRVLTALRISPSATLQMLPRSRREELIAWVAARYPKAPIDPVIEEEMWGGKGGYR